MLTPKKKKSPSAWTVTALALWMSPFALGDPPSPTLYQGEKVHPNRFLVHPKQTLCTASVGRALPQGGTLTELLEIAPAAVLETHLPGNYTQTLRSLQNCGQFSLVEPDYEVRKTSLDSAFTNGTLWGLKNTGQNGGTPEIDINAEPAWSQSKGEGAIVAVIDTGVLYTHADLAPNMWVNPNEIPDNGLDDDQNGAVDDIHGLNAIYTDSNNLYSGDVLDTDGHGTHVAGTIAAIEGGGPLVGVAPQAKIMALKFMEDGTGWTSDAITCLNYAVGHGAHLTNNSWGWSGPSSTSLHQAIKASIDKNVPFVAAAGNNAENILAQPFYPAAYPEVLSVSAIDRNGNISTWSNTGATLAAPGQAIFSSTSSSNSSYEIWNGTSMAAPHVSGVLALLQSQNSTLSLTQKTNALLLSLRPLPSLVGKTTYAGIPNSKKTLTHSHTIPPQTPPSPPSPPPPPTGSRPLLSTPAKKTLKQGRPTSFSLSAANSPTSFSASNLPAGLSLDPYSGTIWGTPTQRNKILTSTVNAHNAFGSDSKTIVFKIAPGKPPKNPPNKAPKFPKNPPKKSSPYKPNPFK